MSQYDLSSVYDFCLHTPEQGLRKMLVDGKSFTDVHFGLLIKITRACDEQSFANHWNNKDFPKVKFGPAETKLKESFWTDCEKILSSRGLLSAAPKAA